MMLKDFWLWLATLPSPWGEALLIVAGALTATVINAVITRPPGKKLSTHTFDKWMGFAEILQTVILSTILGVIYIFVVPFFWLLFMRRHDLLGTDLTGDTFWHDSAEVEFTMRRTYKLY